MVARIVAWVALAVSLASLGLVVWDKFLRRARFDVAADWVLGAGEPLLRFVVFNVGSRKGTVRDIRLRTHDMPWGRGWTPYASVMTKLPIVLDADEGSNAFELLAPVNTDDMFEDQLRIGNIDTIEVEDARGTVAVHVLPDLWAAKSNAMTNAGRGMPKTRP